VKKGLKAFKKIYDLECERTDLFLDLAQNLRFRFEAGNKEITEDDIDLCAKIFRLEMMKVIHKLAFKLGFTGEDYIQNKKNKCNIYLAGVGSISYKEGNE
jgi:hypothetical protein